MRSPSLRMLWHHFVPASLYGRETAFASLSEISTRIAACEPGPSALPRALEQAQTELFAQLRKRFGLHEARALTIKILNTFLARHHFRRRSVVVGSRPVGLVVDPSNTCRLACPGCVHSARSEELGRFDWPNGTLSEARFSALLERFGVYAVGVYFCDYGEPLLNLRTPNLIRSAKRHLLSTMLSTSLSVKKFAAEAYVESGLDFMVLSIDGATQPTYEKFRRNGDLDLVFSNVRRLVEAKRRIGSRTPVLSWNFLAFEHNSHEIPLAARKARQLGVNQFRVVEPFDVGWDDPTIRPARVKAGVRRFDWQSFSNDPENWNPFQHDLAEEAIRDSFEKPYWSHALTDESRQSSGHTCHWLYKNMVMDAGGRILPCCGAPQVDGNLIFDTFEESAGDSFNSEKYQAARAHFAGQTTNLSSTTHCTQCEWDQETVNIGGPEIRRYFRASDPAFFDRQSLRLLSDW